ncbi:ACP S-malonyltransferase [Endozoicomonas sp. Mp262]|uniref:ACP S-malonyltransferase n=1 Tax=Endozoicomonas sp. Mp262 TaxID=2919499 RepID=UPI0021DA5810
MTDKLAFIFPGQGSQQVGMLADYMGEPVVRDTLEEASQILGLDLMALFSRGPAEELNRTENTQPALLAASVALWRLWASKNPEAKLEFLAGHSLGEYSALVCSGSLDFKEAVSLVRKRGLFMQGAVAQGEGAMAAILGLSDDQVIEVCQSAAQGGVVEAVNFNSPGQVVIAGGAGEVKRAAALAGEAGARKAIMLPVSVPSHCALMKPAAEQLKVELEKISIIAPSIPVVQNVSASVVTEPEAIRNNLVAQLYSPVRWVESIELMHKSGVAQFVECGPGKVLAGLNKRIVRRVPVTPLESLSAMDKLLEELSQVSA